MSRWARVARGAVVASVSVFVAALSHLSGGGSPPGLVGVILALTFALLVSVFLAGRRLSLIRLGISVVVSQAMFHGLFSFGAGPSSLVSPDSGHHGGAGILSPQMMTDTAHAGHAGAGMWIAHGCAAVVTAALLWRGEAALWSLLAQSATRLVAVILGHLLAPAPIGGSRVVRLVGVVHLMRDDLGVVLSIMRHRGPPSSLLS